MKPSVYVETSVLHYLTGRPTRDVVTAARQHSTREWWARAAERFVPVISDLVLPATDADPGAVRAQCDALASCARIEVTSAAHELAERLVAAAAPRGATADAAHVAVAAVHGIPYLLTWNVARLANPMARLRIEAACRSAGHECPAICSPDELMAVAGMTHDPIVAEVRAVRDRIAAECGYDVHELFRRIRQWQAESGREYVSYAPRRVAPVRDEAADGSAGPEGPVVGEES